MPRAAPTAQTLPNIEPVWALLPSAAGMYLPWFDEPPQTELAGAVALVRIEGGLAQRGDWWCDGYDDVEARLRKALANPAVTSVVLVINSPGGAAAGCFEAARRMRDAVKASGKPCVAYADEMAASAAYALACVADEIWLPPSGLVGSVGVITAMVDETALNQKLGLKVVVLTTGERKADGHPDVPISKEAMTQVQARVDHLGGLFAEWVAERRASTAEQVLALQAGCFSGGDALVAGLADRVGSLDQAVAAVAARAPKASAAAAARASPPAPAASAAPTGPGPAPAPAPSPSPRAAPAAAAVTDTTTTAAPAAGVRMHPELLKRLGLPEGTTDEQAQAALVGHIDRLAAATGKDNLSSIVATSLLHKSSHERLSKVEAEAKKAKAETEAAKVKNEVDAKIKTGCLFEHERAFYEGLGASDPATYREAMDLRTEPVVDTRADIRPATPATRGETKAADVAAGKAPNPKLGGMGRSAAEVEKLEAEMRDAGVKGVI